MRKLSALFFLLATITIGARAQNHGTVKAVILDTLTNQPISLATVSILKQQDSSLVSYTITDKNGAFTLHNVHEEPSRLLISHVGYQTLHINLKFKKDGSVDLGKIYMSAKMLNEIVVKGERVPILIKKDTIEFDAEAFKTRPNALVEDLLKKLPGIQVDFNGKITVNGKNISKIRVNGKDFFISDPTIATRQLEANMISKVQVYDDRDNDPDHLVPESEVNKIINLKFKKNFAKGFLSTLAGAAGTQDRYAGDAFAAKFQDDLQLSAKVGVDNLSNTGLFSGNSGGFINYNFPTYGIRKSSSGNFDFTKDLSKKSKLHIEYRFTNGINDDNTTSKVQQNISDTIISTLNTAIRHSHVNTQDLHVEAEWKPDSVTDIKFNPDAGYNYHDSNNSNNSTTSNTYVPLVNTIAGSDHGHDNSLDYHHNFSYYRRLNKKGASISIGNTIGIQPSNSLDFNSSDLISYVATLASDTLRRSSRNTSRDVSGVLNAAYHYPLSEHWSADFSVIGLHDHNRGQLLTYDEDFKTGLYTIFLADQSNNLIRNLWGESATPQLTYNFTDNIYIKGGLTAMTQQIGNHFSSTVNDLNQDFFYVLPSAEVHVKDLTLSYNETVQQPSINNLQPITIIYDPLHTFIGNPNLKPTYLHNITLSYHKYNFQKGLNFNVNGRVIIEKNTVVSEQTINAEGATITSPINRNGRFTSYLNSYFSKGFKKHNKFQVYLTTQLNGSVGHNFFIVNRQDGYQNTQNVNITQDIDFDWNDAVNIRPYYNINFATTQFKQVNYPNTNYTTQGAGLDVTIRLPESFTWRANYMYKYNPIVAPGFDKNSNLLNFTFAKRIQEKGRGEIGIVCYDLLNQNVSAAHYVVGNTITDIQNQVLKRYILLTYTYHLKQFK
ncbi:outer membrane beta-barrel protein [Mucilaginibacter sp. BJC16-A38]|uniref:outer membrane beta-barrel protein n=1 Tax=Mucilaginibacter phenanthrenivorans TaxID=1234842 RepID=UPI0021571991|nr:outer membrane beta-barrel protein [Mucilaginibacter phenanthrenivorans]MCR8561819.1 outer membrane beta-barrel protein [Mucilaginibacter phenanthrenivorans]